MVRSSCLAICLLLGATGASYATVLDPIAINAAAPSANGTLSKEMDAFTVRIQILLARAHFSPGEIDGKDGENVQKALRAYAAANNMTWTGVVSPEIWDKIQSTSTAGPLETYQTTDADFAGPFDPKLPRKMDDMKGVKAMSFRTPVEGLAERFHISEELLRALNPKAKFAAAGEIITVPNVKSETLLEGKVARLEVDKDAQIVRAFDEQGAVVAFYPATVGSDEKPTPDGTLKIVAVQKKPVYHYNPEYAFKGVKSKKAFDIAAGPNNPVGAIWIGLSEKGYGIHGTPEPSKISKAESHGCVRLTNWDAMELGGVVKKGLKVAFARRAPASPASKVSLD